MFSGGLAGVLGVEIPRIEASMLFKSSRFLASHAAISSIFFCRSARSGKKVIGDR
jgi:hypothetical protein